MNFTLTQLEYVLAVHKFGHFAKAADFCHITQPTLSMQIQKLEESLNVTIFDRSKKPILPTDIGKILIEQIRLAVSEAKKIEDIIHIKLSAPLAGKIHLGVIPTIAPYLLPRLLPVLEKEFPDIQLKIQELQTHQIIESLSTDEIDVGILALPTLAPKTIEKSLYFEPFSILCRNNHELCHLKKIRQSSLKYDDIWLLEEGHCLRNQVLDICNAKTNLTQKRKYQFESGNLETLKNLITSYGGYTLLPWLAKDNLNKHSEIREFERPIPAREIGIIYRREFYKINLIEALCSAIINSLPENLKKIKQKDLDVLPIT